MRRQTQGQAARQPMNRRAAMSKGLVHFVHGKESGPNGSKIAALAQVARYQGLDVASLDYSHTTDPALRLDQLRKACKDLGQTLLLVGSSMGGWVAAEASGWLDAYARPRPLHAGLSNAGPCDIGGSCGNRARLGRRGHPLRKCDPLRAPERLLSINARVVDLLSAVAFHPVLSRPCRVAPGSPQPVVLDS